MRLIIGRHIDRGEFAPVPPVPGAELRQWTVMERGGIRFGKTLPDGTREPAERLPEVEVGCEA